METRQSVRINRFLGLMSREADLSLPPGAFSAINNIEFFQNGLRTRRGRTLLGSALGSQPVNGIYDGHNHILVASGAGVWSYDPSGDTFTSRKTGLTSNAVPDFASYGGLDIMVNGADAPQKWDGSSWGALGGSPSTGSTVAVWRNHVFIGGIASPQESEVQYSGVENAEKWDDYLRVGKQARGLTVVKVLPVPVPGSQDGSRLGVFCDNSIHHFDGFGRTSFQVYEVNNNIGLSSKRGIVVAEGITYWIHWSGIYASSDGGRTVSNLSWPIQPTFDNLGTGRLSVAVAAVHRKKRQVWFSVTDGSGSTHDKVLVYHYGLSTPLVDSKDPNSVHVWSVFDHACNALAEVEVSGDLRFYGGSAASDGKVWQLDSGTNDEGAVIPWSFQTNRFLLQDWSAWSVMRKLVLIHKSQNATAKIDLYADSAGAIAQSDTLSLAGSGDVFGVGVFGTAKWGGSDPDQGEVDYSCMLRAAKWGLSGNTLNELFQLYEYGFEFRPVGRHR